MSSQDDAIEILRELIAGADDHRCWWIPDEIAARVREVVELDEAIRSAERGGPGT